MVCSNDGSKEVVRRRFRTNDRELTIFDKVGTLAAGLDLFSTVEFTDDRVRFVMGSPLDFSTPDGSSDTPLIFTVEMKYEKIERLTITEIAELLKERTEHIYKKTSTPDD